MNTKIPTEPKATSVRSCLIKAFGGEAIRSTFSDPYSKTQVVRLSIPASKVEDLKKELVNQGWVLNQEHTMESVKETHFPFEREGSAQITVDTDGFVTIYGKKPSKSLDVPIYD